MRSWLALILVAGITGTVLANAIASDSPHDELFGLSLEEFLNVEIVSVSRKSERSLSAPGTVYVITAEQIDIYGFRSLQEALKIVPSVYLYDPHSWVWGGQRGFVSNFSQTLLLINGREVNNLIAGEAFISRQFGTHNIDRIEVVASPASALYGANALAGVINIITRDADPTFEGAEFTLEGGSHNTGSGSVLFGKRWGALSIKGALRYFRSDEEDFLDFVRDGNRYGRGWTDHERALPFMTAYDNTSEATTLSLQADYGHWYVGLNYYLNEQSHGMEKLRWDYTDGEDVRDFALLYAGYDGELGETSRLKAEYQFIRSYMWGSYDGGTWPVARLQASADTPIYPFPAAVTASDGTLLRGRDEIVSHYDSFADYLFDQGLLNSDSTSAELESYLQHIYSNKDSDGSKRHRFDCQWSWDATENTAIDLGYAFDLIDYAGLAVTDAGLGRGGSVNVGVDSSLRQDVYESLKHGLYGQLSHGLCKDRVHINAGVRYDDQEHYGSTTSPRFGLVAQPDDKTTVKLLYGEAYREPNVFELSSNPKLDPAELHSYEAAAFRTFGDHTRIGLAWYHSTIDDFISSVGSLIGSGVGAVEEQTVEGIEWTLDVHKGPAALFVNAAHIVNAEQQLFDSESDTRSKVELLGLPEHKANIGMSYALTTHLSAAFIYSYIHSYDAPSGNAAVTEPFKIGTAHDVKLSIRLSDVEVDDSLISTFLTVNNLTDEDNYHANIRRSGPHAFKQAGRSVALGMAMKF
jgi:outer membrane receptor protein involved in Fe transport